MEFTNLLNVKSFSSPLFRSGENMVQEELYSYPLGQIHEARPPKSMNFNFMSQTKYTPTLAMPVGLSFGILPSNRKLEDLRKNMLSYVVGGFVGSKSQQNKEKSEPFPIGDLIVHLLEEKERTPPKSSQSMNLVEGVVSLMNSSIMRSFGTEVSDPLGAPSGSSPPSAACIVGAAATCMRLLSECSIDSNDSDFIQFVSENDDLLETDDEECYCGMTNQLCVCEDESDSEDDLDCIAPPDLTNVSCDKFKNEIDLACKECERDVRDCTCEVEEEEEDDKVKQASTRWEAAYGSSPPSQNESSNCKVRFNPQPSVRTLCVWSHAHQAARKGPWEEVGRDRCRFAERINRSEQFLSPVLTEKHRAKIWASLQSTTPPSSLCGSTSSAIRLQG